MTDDVKPIGPGDVQVAKAARVPGWVIGVWNGLIAKEWNGSKSTVMQDDAIAALILAHSDQVEDIFATGWLDIEDVFRLAGWSVKYDKPSYSENYRAHFVFTKPK